MDRDPGRPHFRVALATARARGGLCGADSKEKFVKDFAKAWTKVMNLDRFDLVSREEPLAMAAE